MEYCKSKHQEHNSIDNSKNRSSTKDDKDVFRIIQDKETKNINKMKMKA